MWLITLIDKILCWLPRPIIVAPDEGGYRVSPRLFSGVRVKQLYPGWYLWLPLLQRREIIAIKTQVKDLRAQSLWTQDGHNILISGVIRYKIIDPVKACLEVWDYDESIQTVALGVIHRFVRMHTLQECKQRTSDLLDKILSELRKESQGWGLKIQSVELTDTGDVFNLRLLQNKE